LLFDVLGGNLPDTTGTWREDWRANRYRLPRWHRPPGIEQSSRFASAHITHHEERSGASIPVPIRQPL